MSESPKPLGGNVPTGDVPTYPRQGKSPYQRLAIRCPSGSASSPQAKRAPSRPPRAARSHSASVGSTLPAHAA